MEKPYYMSKTVWSGVIAILTGAYLLYKGELTAGSSWIATGLAIIGFRDFLSKFLE